MGSVEAIKNFMRRLSKITNSESKNPGSNLPIKEEISAITG